MRIFSRTRNLRNLRVSFYPFDRPAIKHFSNCPFITANYSRETESQRKKEKITRPQNLLFSSILRDAKRFWHRSTVWKEFHAQRNWSWKLPCQRSRILLRFFLAKNPAEDHDRIFSSIFSLFTFSNLEKCVWKKASSRIRKILLVFLDC